MLVSGVSMKNEDTKKMILKKALELFSESGYDAVKRGGNCKGSGD